MGKIEGENYEKIQPIERQRLYAFGCINVGNSHHCFRRKYTNSN